MLSIVKIAFDFDTLSYGCNRTQNAHKYTYHIVAIATLANWLLWCAIIQILHDIAVYECQSMK